MRYISRTSLPALYNEGVLEVCAEVDEVMDTVCQLEVRKGSGLGTPGTPVVRGPLMGFGAGTRIICGCHCYA